MLPLTAMRSMIGIDYRISKFEITIGKNVFLNTSCHFQDQGGITMVTAL